MPWWRRARLEADLDRELRAHLELEAEELRDSGVPAREAAFAAQCALGNTTVIKEEVRTMWGWTNALRSPRYTSKSSTTFCDSPATGPKPVAYSVTVSPGDTVSTGWEFASNRSASPVPLRNDEINLLRRHRQQLRRHPAHRHRHSSHAGGQRRSAGGGGGIRQAAAP